MKKLSAIFLFAILLVFAQSCVFIGEGTLAPLDSDSRNFDLRDFDQLEIGNAFDITVRQSGRFSIFVRGDRRDIQDLDVYVDRSGKLVMKYRNWRLRRYDMDVEITMPTLRGIDFSGATNSSVTGFGNIRDLDVELSGASKSTIDGDWDRVNVNISGASDLNLRGQGLSLGGDLSGASRLDAFDYPVDNADLDLSGASTARVLVGKTLKVSASGASTLRYRGNPDVRPNISGGSTVKPD
jgi:Putative auto-transporter adhesin, head GIN domain